MISSRLASAVDLGTILGVEDLHDLLEVLSVDAHNRRVMQAKD